MIDENEISALLDGRLRGLRLFSLLLRLLFDPEAVTVLRHTASILAAAGES